MLVFVSCRFRLLGLLLAISLPILAIGGARADGDEEPGQTPECIDYRGEARYRGLGYVHVVVIESSCRQTARCRVSTNVDPEVHEVDVPAGETEEVITRSGSPARAFTPNVSCTLR
jgi:hypothetical protein